MNKQEYADYEAAVAHFFECEAIVNLSTGYSTCPNCGAEWEDATCPNCGADREVWEEPSFSWQPCECCGDPLGGDRYHTTGWNPETEEVCEYEVCPDCVYYAEYGCLDDATMMEVEG